MWKGAGRTILARVRGNGAYITRASLAEVRRYVTYRDGTPDTVGVALTITDVVFDTLQEAADSDDCDYQFDAVADAELGFNLRDPIPASVFTATGPVQITYVYTPEAGFGEPFIDVYQGLVEDPLLFN